MPHGLDVWEPIYARRPGPVEVIERLTQEVVRREPHREGVEEALDGPYDRSLAPHVLEKQ